MKKKSVLLVNNDNRECEVIRNVLTGMFSNLSVNVVGSGRSALDTLMGSASQVPDPDKNPDVIIISNSITDITPAEICNVISNYYRFRHIKFYLLADPQKVPRVLTEWALFNGYLNRPIGDDPESRVKLEQLSTSLGSDKASFAFLPALSILKEKLSILSGSLSAGAKTAALATCVGTMAVVVPVLGEDNPPAEIKTPLVAGTLIDAERLPAKQVALPVEEIPEVVNEPVAPAATIQESSPPAVEVIPEAEKDTVMPKKKFSIGVKSIKP